jgi:hypothetical protein
MAIELASGGYLATLYGTYKGDGAMSGQRRNVGAKVMFTPLCICFLSVHDSPNKIQIIVLYMAA